MDAIFPLTTLYLDENVIDELYILVRDNLYSQLDVRLQELPNSIDYLTTLRYHDQEQVSLLMVAAMNGYDDIVRLLLRHWNSIDQIELKSQIIVPNEKYTDSVTALYGACYRGHFTVAKTLIEIGHANTNQDTDDNPHYPLLICAAMMNRLDIVRFLIENKYADVNGTKSTDCNECTALIWAAFRGHINVVKYLIECGADVNYSCVGPNVRARTPILCAILAGHVESVRLLYERGANITIKHDLDETPLMMAIERSFQSIIIFLLEQSLNTIDDLELAACSLINSSSSIGQMHQIFELLKLALEQRALLNIPKVCLSPISIYNYEQECQTIDELNNIKDNRDRIFLETLLIRERIFQSKKDMTIMKPLHDYGDMLVSRKEFGKCLDVWIYMFYLYQQTGMSTTLHRFVWLFCRMFAVNEKIPVERFLQVCQLVFEPSQIEEKNITIFNALFLVIIGTKILEQEGITKEEKISIYGWVKDLCHHQFTTTDGSNLLHLCVNDATNRNLSFRSVHVRQYLKFPNESGFRLILSCGRRWFDFDAVDSIDGNTPLHILCRHSVDPQFIKLLVDYGFHIDCVNTSGYLPIDYTKNSAIRILLRSKVNPNHLKCFCARIIAQKRLNTECLGPRTSPLSKFVFLHGRLHMKSDCD